MAKTRLLVFCLLGFSAPIALAAFLGNSLHEPSSQIGYQRGILGDSFGTIEDDKEIVAEPIEDNSLFKSVASDESLDPKEGKPFLVSALVYLKQYPKLGKRQKVIFKYAGNKSPYPGWAFALNKRETSLRPEIYWQDQSGSGGWFPFEAPELKTDSWYLFTIIFDGSALSVYMSVLDSTSPSFVRGEFPSAVKLSRLKFLGGHEVEGIALPTTTDSLYFRSPGSKDDSFYIDLAQVLVLNGGNLPEEDEDLREILAGGIPALLDFGGQNAVQLFVNADGEDVSPNMREVVTKKSR